MATTLRPSTAGLGQRRRARALRPDDDATLAEPTAAAARITEWASRQVLLLEDLYAEAYVQGHRNFRAQFPELAEDLSEPAGVMPDPEAMTMHRLSVAKLAGEVHRLVAAGADRQAIGAWFDANERRLDQTADTLAWTAEQHGYHDAGASSGLEIDWELDEGPVKHCEDCPRVAEGSPYTPRGGDHPLPFLPGTGHTRCGANCRCSLNYRSGDQPAPAQYREAAAAAAQAAAEEMGFGSVEAVHGDDLAATANRLAAVLRWRKRQIGIALDADGRVLAAHVGTPDELVYSQGQLRLMQGAAVHLHNHPDGETFSPADVAFALTMGFGESRLVTADATYVLRPGAATAADVLDAAEEAAQGIAADVQEEARSGYHDQLAGHLRFGTFQSWPDYWARVAGRYWDRVWRRLALMGLLAYFSQAPDESDDQDDSDDGS